MRDAELDFETLAALAAISNLTEEQFEEARAESDYVEAEEDELFDDGRAYESVEDAPTAAELGDLVSASGFKLIVEFEVSNKRNYEKKLRHPMWPGGRSGVTVGIGYDLAHHKNAEIAADWGALGGEAVEALQQAQGLAGASARSHLQRNAPLRKVSVEWELALEVYRKTSLPKYALKTVSAFPGAHRLHGHAFGALVSLVYNRGTSTKGAKRREMSAIRHLCREGAFHRVPAQIRAMKRLWRVKGLLRRREAEARLFESGLRAMAAREDSPVSLESLEPEVTLPASREELAFQVGALIEAAKREGVDPQKQSPALEIAGYEPQPEALIDAVNEAGFGPLIRFGAGVIQEIELKLKRYVCQDLVLDPGFDELGDRVVAAVNSDRAAQTAAGGEKGLTVKDVFADFVNMSLPILPASLCRRVAETLFDDIVEPLLGDAVEITRRRLCAMWKVRPTETDAENEPQPSRAIAEPQEGDEPDGPSRVSPGDDQATGDIGVSDAASRLLRLIQENPGALDRATRDALRSTIGGGTRDGSTAEALLLMEEIRKELALAKDKDTVNDVALDEALGALREQVRNTSISIPLPAAKETLQALRRARKFDRLAALADAFIARRPETLAALGHLYAQGLIDSGRLISGYEVLLEAREQAELIGREALGDLHEILGLMGRAQKQIYVNHARTSAQAAGGPEHVRQALRDAIAHYRSGMDDRTLLDAHWHCANYIALRIRAREDYVAIDDDLDPEALAHELIVELEPNVETERLHHSQHWRLASLAEAFLALRDYDKAAKYYARYADLARYQGPFEISSTIRQLEEVWRLRASTFGPGAILTNLKEVAARFGNVRLSASERFELSQSLGEGQAVEFEQVFLEARTGKGDTLGVFAIKNLARVADAVCALKRRVGAKLRTMGTGFVIDGPSLSGRLSADKSYVMTNAHVLWDPTKDDRPQRAPLGPGDAVVIFESHLLDGREEEYFCGRVIWQSPERECDAVLFELNRKVEGIRPIPLSMARMSRKMPLAIIGHPLGGDLTVALPGEVDKQQATLVDYGPKSPAKDPIFLHYETTTEAGNSGSPVLETDTWSVIGLHHAGFRGRGLLKLSGQPGYNRANEGISLESIRLQVERGLAAEADADRAATPGLLNRILRRKPPLEAAWSLDVDEEEEDPAEDALSAEAAAELEGLALETAPTFERWCPFADQGPAMPYRGRYPTGYPIGAVVHYTAGRFENGAATARSVMSHGAKKRHYYFCIANDGTILQPGPIDCWGSHAGKSWARGLLDKPSTDYFWLSRYLVGIEICGAGTLSKRGELYAPYWNKKFSTKGTLIKANEVRYAAKGDWSNVTESGHYHRYTDAQEESLKKLLVWLHLNNPGVFRIKNILGHDEIGVFGAPGSAKQFTRGRKKDPGGSLSTSMEALRDDIRARVSLANSRG